MSDKIKFQIIFIELQINNYWYSFLQFFSSNNPSLQSLRNWLASKKTLLITVKQDLLVFIEFFVGLDNV